MGFLRNLFGGKRDDAYQQLLAASMAELQAKTAAHDSLIHISESSWAVDQDAGTIVFTRADRTTATCPVQIIGTYNTVDGTFLWGWDHPSVVPPLDAHARFAMTTVCSTMSPSSPPAN